MLIIRFWVGMSSVCMFITSRQYSLIANSVLNHNTLTGAAGYISAQLAICRVQFVMCWALTEPFHDPARQELHPRLPNPQAKAQRRMQVHSLVNGRGIKLKLRSSHSTASKTELTKPACKIRKWKHRGQVTKNS